jgi:hypothetical protein
MNKVDDFDFDFLHGRIEQLLKQFGLLEEAKFGIVFGTFGDEPYDYSGYSSYASMFSNNSNNYTDSAFFSLFVSLLDVFTEYRSQYVIADHYHGIISVEMSAINVEWVDEVVADMVVAILREDENAHSYGGNAH